MAAFALRDCEIAGLRTADCRLRACRGRACPLLDACLPWAAPSHHHTRAAKPHSVCDALESAARHKASARPLGMPNKVWPLPLPCLPSQLGLPLPLCFSDRGRNCAGRGPPSYWLAALMPLPVSTSGRQLRSPTTLQRGMVNAAVSYARPHVVASSREIAAAIVLGLPSSLRCAVLRPN